jgi:hypothetical protein
MADTKGNPVRPQSGETRDMEQDRVRSTNDLDQAAEREGIDSERNRGYDESVAGSERTDEFEDVDPDSADSEIDRDDRLDEI